jgi:hypothetical protein
MNDQELDNLLEAVTRSPEIDQRAFRDGVWAKIDNQASWLERIQKALRPIMPAIGVRAAPAALALVVGGLSGAALAQPSPHDDLAVFDADSSYSIVAMIAAPKDKH